MIILFLSDADVIRELDYSKSRMSHFVTQFNRVNSLWQRRAAGLKRLLENSPRRFSALPPSPLEQCTCISGSNGHRPNASYNGNNKTKIEKPTTVKKDAQRDDCRTTVESQIILGRFIGKRQFSTR
jgi:hypothetical protein